MSTAEKTRPNIAGYPLPLRITSDPIMGEEVVADDGQQIINFADEYDGGFYRELVAKVNRSDALEKALITAVSALEKTIEEGTIRDADEEDAILAGLKETLTALDAAESLAGSGLSHEAAITRLGEGWVGEEALAIAVYSALVADDLVPGNSTEAEEAVS